MLKNLEAIMPKDDYARDMMVLYQRMKSMTSDFAHKKESLAEFNELHEQNIEQLKSVVKSDQIKVEPATKKAKIVTAKKSVFAGTPLDISSTKSTAFQSPALNTEIVTKITDSDYSSDKQN